MGIRSLASRLRPAAPPPPPPVDPAAPVDPPVARFLTDDEQRVIDEVRMHTMISTERLVANMDAVEHVVRRGVPGALVECGVWRGGSVVAMVRVLQRLGVDDRDVYLYDTFTGMTEPEDVDTSPLDTPALQTWRETPDGTRPWEWAFAPDIYDVELVRDFVLATGYPRERVHLVQGTVEETIPDVVPDDVAVLRLDTDWYASTRHELVHLYPRLSPGGVLIIDDYGHWDGARRAVDEYFAEDAPPILLSRIDYSGRIGVKH